jgi:putative transposase
VNPTPSHAQRHTSSLPLATAFAPILCEDQLQQAIDDENIPFRIRRFPPALTFWTFFTQIFHAGASCRNALLRLAAAQLADQPNAQTEPLYTGTYCKARKRLPEALLTRLSRGIADRTQNPGPHGTWKGHIVKITDGSTISMPDTEANQEEFPQSSNQKRGVGFPLARLLVIVCLATGCIRRSVLGPHKGKGTAEGSLLAQQLDEFQPHDLLLGDAGFSYFWLIASLKARGADYLGDLSSTRKADYRTGRRLGPKDHSVVWKKSKSRRTPGLSEAEWESLPETLEVRRLWVRVERPGFRTKGLHLVTTLLDAARYSKADVAALYQRRWQVELHLRTLKADLEGGVLRCQSPAMIRKEWAMHAVVFNAIRAVMVKAGVVVKREPYRLSFTAAWEAIESFAGVLSNPATWEKAWRKLLQVIGKERVDDRPNRVEPRLLKRRPKDCKHMTKPRHEYPRITRSSP